MEVFAGAAVVPGRTVSPVGGAGDDGRGRGAGHVAFKLEADGEGFGGGVLGGER